MQKRISFGTNYGRVNSNLKAVMDRKEISINTMSKLADIKYHVVKRYYYNNDLYHVDLQLLAKFCYILDCKISDILEYEYSEENIASTRV